MTANITFSKYSEDREFNNLYISNKIMDEILDESNNIILEFQRIQKELIISYFALMGKIFLILQQVTLVLFLI